MLFRSENCQMILHLVRVPDSVRALKEWKFVTMQFPATSIHAGTSKGDHHLSMYVSRFSSVPAAEEGSDFSKSKSGSSISTNCAKQGVYATGEQVQ